MTHKSPFLTNKKVVEAAAPGKKWLNGILI
jgi:hypothetical protein